MRCRPEHFHSHRNVPPGPTIRCLPPPRSAAIPLWTKTRSVRKRLSCGRPARAMRPRTSWLLLVLTAVRVLRALPMIDMMTAHDEIPMLRYRLRLHAPVTVKTIILEGNLSHAGYPKPLHVRDSLTPEEIERYNIQLINVPFGRHLEQRMVDCRNGTSVKCTWLLEIAQRKFIMGMLKPTIDRVLAENKLDDVLVHMSDLDELLDPDAVRNLSTSLGCVSPKLRNYVYGERCPGIYPPWSRSVLFRAKSGWLKRHASPHLQLRKLAKGMECDPSSDWLGWHFGYFMSTEKILVRVPWGAGTLALQSDLACSLMVPPYAVCAGAPGCVASPSPVPLHSINSTTSPIPMTASSKRSPRASNRSRKCNVRCAIAGTSTIVGTGRCGRPTMASCRRCQVGRATPMRRPC